MLEPKKILKGDDIGSRLQHMMELQELWSTAYAVLTRPDLFHTPLEEAHAEELRMALKLLENHLEAEYNPSPYAKAINALPKP
jgi:hypothetical protein